MVSSLFKNKTLLLLGGGVVVALLIWYGFLRSDTKASLLTTEELTTTNGEVDSDVVATLLTLRAVSLTGSIFEDPAFQQLQDFGSEIMLEPVGRPNPFAPIGIAPTSTGASPAR